VREHPLFVCRLDGNSCRFSFEIGNFDRSENANDKFTLESVNAPQNEFSELISLAKPIEDSSIKVKADGSVCNNRTTQFERNEITDTDAEKASTFYPARLSLLIRWLFFSSRRTNAYRQPV